MKTFSGDDAIDPSGVSLKGYYWIGAVSIAIGVAVVFIPNAVTPVEFILQRMARFRGASSAAEYGGNIIVFAVTLSCVFFVTTGVLNRQVSRNISRPLADISHTLTRACATAGSTGGCAWFPTTKSAMSVISSKR